VMGTSERTAQRDWDKARILLQHQLRAACAPAPRRAG